MSLFKTENISAARPYVTAVIVAAGNSTRMGGVNKQFLLIDGVPVLIRTLLAFEECENVNEIIPNIETPAFGYEKKMIVAKNTKLFTRKSKKNASDNNIENTEANNKNVDRLVEYLKENSIDDVELVFVEETCEKNSLFNLISKIGQVKEFKELGVNELLPEIRKIASMYKVNIDNYTASYFIECVGNNMQDIINEIRKLIEYVGEGGTIKKEDIDSLTIKKTTSIIFDLTDSLGQKNIKKAIETLHNLQYNKEPTQVIIVMLYRHFKKLYFVHLWKNFIWNY